MADRLDVIITKLWAVRIVLQGLTAEELDVNTHFKNSLGSLYNSTAAPSSTVSSSESAAVNRLSPVNKSSQQYVSFDLCGPSK